MCGCRCCINNISKSSRPTTITYSIMKVTKAIVSLVVVAALGGFGAIDFVQSFQPVRPVALTSVAGFGRLVHDANAAHVSPKSFTPRSVYCNGDKVPCSAAMVRAAATASRCNKLGANVAFRSACGIFPTFLSASSSPEDDPKTLGSVWVQLYVDGEKAGNPAKLKLDIGADVFDLATAVKELLGDDLVGIAPNRLDVYKDEDFAKPLRGNEKIDNALGGENIDNPIRVMARTPNKGTLILINECGLQSEQCVFFLCTNFDSLFVDIILSHSKR
jgi:hypothetical protein